ncbi:simple sugar transport system permease protein/ribose transport system permease protein [Salinibacillus kushneri]|uniref:Simple sugar transport system permease protein/ribose transport system permease protein n=1 Tax=Salinibacillus kushneri TaxID=237682 RepID=A0A1H9YZS5_9BACI|nr:ABC transporter permease [Salinibacillus kushneri]SES74702.1 simple sugar transport system permease protein/ribose transport system permease protein [Salinibacillus kushneri]
MKLTKESILGLIALGTFILMSLIAPGFLGSNNLSNFLFQLPEFGLLALGMMVVIITGGIDLSITYVAALSGVGAALMLTNGYSIISAIVVAIIFGVACGAFNGFVVSKIGVPPILVTLGTMVLFEGVILAITKGNSISGFGDTYSLIGNGYYMGVVPLSILIFIFFAILTGVLLNKSSWGRSIYMYGNNEIATLFSGIRNSRVLMKVYLYVGLLAAISAIIMTSRYNSVKVDLGSSYLLQSVAAAVLGGTNIHGGYGKVIGTVYAVIIFQTLSNGLNLLGVHSAIVDVFIGGILILVLTLNFFSDKMKSKKESRVSSVS